MVANDPDALPTSVSGTADTTHFVMAGIAIASPAPDAVIGPTSAAYPVVGEATAASHASPNVSTDRPAIISGRTPMRSDNAPAPGARSSGAMPHGNRRTPAARGCSPRATWKNCAVKKTAPVIAPLTRKIATLLDVNARDRNSRGGSIGVAVRRSHATNTPAATSPAPIEANVSGLAQPAALPRTRPQTTPKAAAVMSARPTMSMRTDGPRLSATRANSGTIAPAATGTLSQKIHCHAIPCVTALLSTGPTTTDNPVTLP